MSECTPTELWLSQLCRQPANEKWHKSKNCEWMTRLWSTPSTYKHPDLSLWPRTFTKLSLGWSPLISPDVIQVSVYPPWVVCSYSLCLMMWLMFGHSPPQLGHQLPWLPTWRCLPELPVRRGFSPVPTPHLHSLGLRVISYQPAAIARDLQGPDRGGWSVPWYPVRTDSTRLPKASPELIYTWIRRIGRALPSCTT